MWNKTFRIFLCTKLWKFTHFKIKTLKIFVFFVFNTKLCKFSNCLKFFGYNFLFRGTGLWKGFLYRCCNLCLKANFWQHLRPHCMHKVQMFGLWIFQTNIANICNQSKCFFAGQKGLVGFQILCRCFDKSTVRYLAKFASVRLRLFLKLHLNQKNFRCLLCLLQERCQGCIFHLRFLFVAWILLDTLKTSQTKTILQKKLQAVLLTKFLKQFCSQIYCMNNFWKYICPKRTIYFKFCLIKVVFLLK